MTAPSPATLTTSSRGAAAIAALSWAEREQLAALNDLVLEHDAVRQGTYMYQATRLSLDSKGRPVIVTEFGLPDGECLSKTWASFWTIQDAIDHIVADTYFHVLKKRHGLQEANAWAQSIDRVLPFDSVTTANKPAELTLIEEPAEPTLRSQARRANA